MSSDAAKGLRRRLFSIFFYLFANTRLSESFPVFFGVPSLSVYPTFISLLPSRHFLSCDLAQKALAIPKRQTPISVRKI